MRFPTRAWHEGQYVIGVVSAYDKATNLYTVDYKSGPYHQTDGPHLNPSVKGLPDGTVIEKVHREHLCGEEAVSSTDNFPFLMILVSLCQVICFAYWAPKMAEALLAAQETAKGGLLAGKAATEEARPARRGVPSHCKGSL